MDMYRHFYPPIPDPEARQSFVPLSDAHQTVSVQDPNPRDLATFLIPPCRHYYYCLAYITTRATLQTTIITGVGP